MAGLLLIKEFHDWTEEQAVNAYMFHADVQYALNLPPAMQSLSVRTVQRYEDIFREDELAARVMHEVTNSLVAELDLDISRQRLDSTHFESNMATFGRTRMMGVTIKRFLTQVKRHAADDYAALPEDLRERYAPSVGLLFAGANKDKRTALRQQVAEDMCLLIDRFADNKAIAGRQTYKALLRVFEDQCEVREGAIVVKKKTGGDVVQNPSDPDATYDGKKGAGYQLQVSETCSDANEVQLIVAAKVETAVASDQNAIEPVLEALEQDGHLPDQLLADGGYGSDDNIVIAAEKNVDLQSPVSGAAGAKHDQPYQLNVDDFAIDPKTQKALRCPAGHEPLASIHDPETAITVTTMPAEACAGCEFGAECPIKRIAGEFQLRHAAKDQRLAARRREQDTKPFQENYRKRAGGESVNSGLKRVTGLARLRVRGLPAIAHAAYMRIAGWNIFRAATSLLLRAKLKRTAKSATASESGQEEGAEGDANSGQVLQGLFTPQAASFAGMEGWLCGAGQAA